MISFSIILDFVKLKVTLFRSRVLSGPVIGGFWLFLVILLSRSESLTAGPSLRFYRPRCIPMLAQPTIGLLSPSFFDDCDASPLCSHISRLQWLC